MGKAGGIAVLNLEGVQTRYDNPKEVLSKIAKATPDEAAGYKGWLYGIAVTTAQAGKEDQGFLGRGGVQVNDAERAALSAIAEVLGVEPNWILCGNGSDDILTITTRAFVGCGFQAGRRTGNSGGAPGGRRKGPVLPSIQRETRPVHRIDRLPWRRPARSRDVS